LDSDDEARLCAAFEAMRVLDFKAFQGRTLAGLPPALEGCFIASIHAQV
jgi:hypothetical protein